MDAGGGGSQQPPSSSSAFDDFNIDKQEYQSVFKVFDKNNTGEINIGQVFELINKFDQAAKVNDTQSSSTAQQQSQMNKNMEPQSTGLRQMTNMGGQGSKMPQKQQMPGGMSNKNNFSPSTKKEGGGASQQRGQPSQFPSGGGLQLKPTPMETTGQINSKSPRMIPTQKQQKDQQQINEEVNFGNVPLQDEKKGELTFPNGKTTLKFEDFFGIVKDSCADKEQAENYLIHAFSMFDRKKYDLGNQLFRKGYISSDDLKEVFKLLGETVTDEEVNTMIKIAGVKSNDKINFKEFVDFFNKVD